MDYLGNYEWKCEAHIQTCLKDPWLQSLAHHEDFRPLILNAVRGSYALLGEGALRLTFAIEPMNYEEAVEEAETTTGVIMTHMRLNDKVKELSIHVSSYNDPEPTAEPQAKVIPFPPHQ